jgi:hypothetical protein
MILTTILNHFRLKRRIRQAADDLASNFPDDPLHEAKMRAFCERTGERVHFWTRVAKELGKRETNSKPRPLTPFSIRRQAMMKREQEKRGNGPSAA